MLYKPSVKYLGHVAIVRAPLEPGESLEKFASQILSSSPRVRTVVVVEGVEGVYRIPRIRSIFGEPLTETFHRENGIAYKLDASSLMFSLGNSFERLRMKRLPERGETVVDMFAGVGQFTIPAAKSKAEKVVSFELNPKAYEYLKQNIKLNKVGDKVEAYCDDCRNSPKYGLKADRVIMGYLHGTINYLPAALKIAKHRAVIHFHELARPNEGWRDLYNLCVAEAKQNGVELQLEGWRVVKTYSRRLWHWVLDLGLSQPLFQPSCDR
ncbi:MAG: RsmD family RNA methyltransferase [Candidatus Caldarchaeum sp.]|nr:RsmD family RNA methyltransferase [Candidatus Caldarchaeum sp.]